MKTIRQNSTGIEARLIQAMLNFHMTHNGQVTQVVKECQLYKDYVAKNKKELLPLAVDGNFGSKSVLALKVFQSLNGMVVDGSCGPATQRAMWILPSANQKIVTIKFPLKNIRKQCVINHNGDKTSNLSKCVSEGKGNIGSNAGMFNNTSKGQYAYVLLNDTLDNGQPIRLSNGATVGGNYLPDGLALCNDRRVGSVYCSTTQNSMGKPVDFVGCNELLIQDNKKVMKITNNLGQGFMKQKTAWFAWGVDVNYLYYMTNLTNTTLNDLAVEGLAQNIKNLYSYDGGGSRCFNICGANVFSTTRVIPQCFVFDIGGLWS